jgi:hypothetical protein
MIGWFMAAYCSRPKPEYLKIYYFILYEFIVRGDST